MRFRCSDALAEQQNQDNDQDNGSDAYIHIVSFGWRYYWVV